jgi:hypothetical protein
VDLLFFHTSETDPTRPVVGGFAAQYKSWQWSQWCMIFITLAAFVIALPMKETYKPVILRQRAKKHGIVPTDDQSGGEKVKNAVVLRVLRPFNMLFTEVGFPFSYREYVKQLTHSAPSVFLLDLHIIRFRCALHPLRRVPIHLPTRTVPFHCLSSWVDIYIGGSRRAVWCCNFHCC